MITYVSEFGSFHIWFLFCLIVCALICYSLEKVAMEVTALGVIVILLFFFHFFPILDADGMSNLSASKILAGFANPALLTVLALLVVGQGVVKTGILEVVSGHVPSSRLLMPLSFVAVVGGMTTLVGSGTNLLVSNALVDAGFESFSFFEFTIPGSLLALTGLAYVCLIAPHLLPSRTTLSHRIRERLDKHFVAEIAVNPSSKLVGAPIKREMFDDFKEINVRLLHREGQTIVPPFHGLHVRSGDTISLSATREELTNLMIADPGLTYGHWAWPTVESHQKSEQLVIEMMVTPSSSLVGKTIEDANFEGRHNCQVLGIQHHAHVIRSQMAKAKLAAGDLLLVKCDSETIPKLRENLDVVLVEFSITELPNTTAANTSIFIFLAVVLSAALDIMPIVISAMVGALAMVLTNVISLQQALQAIDFKIATTIAAALALGVAMEATGAAAYLANLMLSIFGSASPSAILSVFFIMVAMISNLVSTKTCAILFAPIGIQIGVELGIDPRIFAITVVFAANCAFATPFAYQTSLLVLGPGSYQFKDFLKVGSPLIFLIWLVYSLFVPWYYQID